MKKTGIAKLIAVASAFAILATQFTASAKFILTTDMDIMNGASKEIPGFLFDSAQFSRKEYGGHSTYGEYQEHARWKDNLMDTGWNAGDSMNIYPIGTPDTDYYAITDPQTFAEAPYADYEGQDVTVWNGYMFVVMEKTTWVESTEEVGYPGGQGAVFESAIQVYDIANGKKEHVATWDAKDLDLGGTEANLSKGIRQIAVNDEHIFMLLDICAPDWMYKDESGDKDVTSYGCGLAVFDNPISRIDGSYELPTRSEGQNIFEERPEDNKTDREKYGVDTQWRLAAKGTRDGGDMYVRGDYLVYIPQLTMNNIAQGTDKGDDVWKGIHILKWNDPERDVSAPLYFEDMTFQNWLDLSFPEEYKATETGRGEEPDVGAIVIDGDYMYMLMVYTAPVEPGSDSYQQWDQLYIADISDILNPVVVGHSAPMLSRNGEWNLYKKMSVSNGFVYFGYRHWNDNGYAPYLLVLDARDKQNPVLVNEIALQEYDYFEEGNPHKTFGVDSVTAVDDIVIVNQDQSTIFFEFNEDRTAVVDSFYAKCAMMWGAKCNSGSEQPFIYGNRIFYPQMSGEVDQPNEDGTWPTPDGEGPHFRYRNRIEVIDFSAAMPMGLYVDEVTKDNEGTYTISGTIDGVLEDDIFGNEDAAVITVTDENDDYVGDVLYGDLITGIAAEEDITGWSFTIDEEQASELTFVLNNYWGEPIEGLDETVNLALVGVDPIFTMTGTPSGAIAQGEYSITVSASNMTAKDVEDAVVVVAVYDAEGKLVAVATGNPETITSGDAKDLTPVTVTVPQAESYADYTAKALLLDSVEGLAPICPNLTF